MKIRITKGFWVVLTAVIAVRVEHDRLLRGIEADSLFIENLNSEEFLETYAREQFNLQRPGETVYIFE